MSEILSQTGFYSLTGSDGCLCAHITLRGISIDVHCHGTLHFSYNYWGEKFLCNCQWAGIHITPLVPQKNDKELVKIGEIIRAEMSRPDMNIKIVLHEASNVATYGNFVAPPKGERPKEIIISADPPKEGFDFE